MRGALADIADLQRGVVGELLLDREVPLIGNRRTNVGIPEADQGAGEWIRRIGFERQEAVTQRGTGNELVTCSWHPFRERTEG